MIPKFRVWVKIGKRMVFSDDILAIDYENKEIVTQQVYFENGLPDDRDIYCYDFDEIELMQSTGLFDRNGKEIFEGDILKFNDEWNEYCHEGYVDGSVEGVNYVEVVRSEICFEFGKTKYPDSSLFILMEDEQLNFKDFIKSEDFEFEIIGNIYENPELLEVTHE
ncbi:YopX family protein [Streptococcus pneumoniae]|uniref:YopX family protein n=1 Tax=Streptococcus pneumoniae TaxID=1313 RepID=UPI0010F0EAF6|nr:YopX family protein [Streptococcus pneumoniae]MDG7114374.1 YopX family protein [Streptococcus pneumoniae]MDG7217483.1 YopX family protein [Streptococcus pneumoniae]MDG7363779.1 YopX family protein [Streptococcus pneumoniae]MDG7371843.1 YopX family protein [Streptococcus pneumoniae]MDG7742160.1 YopX family protein [Streptococcus pneumoniae]